MNCGLLRFRRQRENTAAVTKSRDGTQARSWEPPQRSEAELVGLAQRGNANAFGELYRLHLDAIYGYVSKRVGGVREVEDLTQTVFLKAWQALERYQASKVPFLVWLYRIAHNAVIDYHRTKKETASLDDQAMPSAAVALPEETIVSQERSETLQKAIAKLRPSYQQVISLRFLCGLDYAETAEVLGREVGTVRVLQFRALKALHGVLIREQPTEYPTTVRE